MRRILVAAVMVGVVVALSACEPAMTITAKPDANPIADTQSHITGAVTPPTATAKVTLQRTVGGKWVDWKSCPASRTDGTDHCLDYTPTPKVPRGNVNQSTGTYTITYPVQWCGVVLHLRVRSSGSSAVSPSFYTQADPHESC